MNTRFILAASTLSILPRFLLAAPDDGKGGGGKPLSLEERLTKASDELTKVTGDLKTANDTIVTLTKERDDAKSDLSKVKSQFAELTKSVDGIKADLTKANDALGAMTKERDTVKADLTRANDNVTRLEALCDVKGVSRSEAVTGVPVEPAPKSSTADWEKKMKDAKTPTERNAITAAFQKAFAAGEIK